MKTGLFRGKCINDDAIYDWVEGYYVCLKDSYKKRETHRIYTGFAESDCGEFYGDWYEVDPKTVTQIQKEYEDKCFVREVKNYKMTDPLEILNWYRNLYYKEGNHTEHGIMAEAINDLFMKYKDVFQ